jgi:hypothetical protein
LGMLAGDWRRRVMPRRRAVLWPQSAISEVRR